MAQAVHLSRVPVPIAAVARLALAALLLMACAITAPQPAAAGRTSFRVSPVARAKAIGKAKKRAAATLATARALARGTAIDGPRHTGRAIRKNPRAFAAGTVLIGTAGAFAHKLGLNGEHRPEPERARWRRRCARLVKQARQSSWPAGSAPTSSGRTVGPACLTRSAATGHRRPPSRLATTFAASAVIGGDAPAVGVTAIDTVRAGTGR